MTMKRVEQTVLAAVVLAMHALLLWAWPQPGPSPRGTPPDVAVRTLPISILPPPPVARAHASTPDALPRVPARARAPAPRPSALPQTERLSLPTDATTTPAPSRSDAAPPPVATAASQPLDLRLRLSPELARRGGLTEPAGSMRAQALNDPRSNHAPDPRQQLPDAVAASAKGDCLKGEYAGWGMGLLSVPFLAYHAAVGNCRPLR
jgi:hypothetical protein